MKRAFDLVVATLLLIVLSPLIAVFALLIRLSSPGPALHRAVRAGRNGVGFTMYKLRTMRPAPGPGITARRDPRITPIGRMLRMSHLDELPQLWNVMRGDMSLVGPRPEDPRFVALYTSAQRAVLSVRPGITGLAQLAHVDEETRLPADYTETAYVRDILPAKLAIDLAYVRERSFVGDLGILVRTIAGGRSR